MISPAVMLRGGRGGAILYSNVMRSNKPGKPLVHIDFLSKNKSQIIPSSSEVVCSSYLNKI